MSRQTGQTSLNFDSHSDELQLVVLIHEILPFEVAQNQHREEFNFLNKAKELKYHYFAVKQQPLLTLPDKTS